jgi:hypothetical protein
MWIELCSLLMLYVDIIVYGLMTLNYDDIFFIDPCPTRFNKSEMFLNFRYSMTSCMMLYYRPIICTNSHNYKK